MTTSWLSNSPNSRRHNNFPSLLRGKVELSCPCPSGAQRRMKMDTGEGMMEGARNGRRLGLRLVRQSPQLSLTWTPTGTTKCGHEHARENLESHGVALVKNFVSERFILRSRIVTERGR